MISFHSLEDRMVKRFMRARSQGCICPPDMPVCGCGRAAEGALLAAKAQRPKQAELDRNPRARSALLRGMRRMEPRREHPRRRPRSRRAGRPPVAARAPRPARGRAARARARSPRRRAARAPGARLVIPLIALVLGGIVLVNVAKLSLTNQTGQVIERARSVEAETARLKSHARAARRPGAATPRSGWGWWRPPGDAVTYLDPAAAP